VALVTISCGLGGLLSNMIGNYLARIFELGIRPLPLEPWTLLNATTPAWFGLSTAVSMAVLKRAWARSLLAAAFAGGFLFLATHLWSMLHAGPYGPGSLMPIQHLLPLCGIAIGSTLAVLWAILIGLRFRLFSGWSTPAVYTVAVAAIWGALWEAVEPGALRAVAFEGTDEKIGLPSLALAGFKGLGCLLFLAPLAAAVSVGVRLDRRFARHLVSDAAPPPT
jgi:hypothetical protein